MQEFSSQDCWVNPVLRDFQDLKRQQLNQGVEICDLSMINPDLGPERTLVDRLVEACLKPGQHRYAVARGIESLRRAFAVKYQQVFAVDLDPCTQICVMAGSKDALFNALACLPMPGRQALIGAPAYPAHIAALTMSGYSVSLFDVVPDEQQLLDNIKLAAAEVQPDLLLLNFPHNPTGITVSAEFWVDLLAWSRAHSIFIINDFVYGEMGYYSSQVSALRYADPMDLVAELYSLSKAYSVPGWRIGALLGNTDLLERVYQRKGYLDYGTFLPLQNAACFALTSTAISVSGTVAEYHQRARLVCKYLERNGWNVIKPAAGCSVWAQHPGTFQSALELTTRLLARGLAVLPGAVFGEQFRNYCRFALVADQQTLMRALDLVNLNAFETDKSLVQAL